jgi:FkbM family methyltransferase
MPSQAVGQNVSRPWRRIIALSFLLLGLVSALAFGFGVGLRYQTFRMLFEMNQRDALFAATKRVIGLQPTYADTLQDLWITLRVAPGKRDGYYVDVGSADGVQGSNSKLLDELGWKGICIDPFPKNMQTRTCKLFKQPVFDVSGQKVKFRDAGWTGGIENTLSTAAREEVRNAPVVEFTTATLDEILAKANAPTYIDFMSIDVEGAEVPVLRGLSLDRYQVGAFCIENDGEPAQSQIRQLLASKGYKHVRSWKRDDWYVRDAGPYENHMEFTPRRDK